MRLFGELRISLNDSFILSRQTDWIHSFNSLKKL